MIKVNFSLIICIVYSCANVYAQKSQEELNRFIQTNEAGYEKFPLESVYFQTSKGIYETGEDLWFKAYMFDSRTFGLSDKSKTLYLQMSSASDSVVWQEMYSIENGIALGHIYIDENLPEGDYF